MNENESLDNDQTLAGVQKTEWLEARLDDLRVRRNKACIKRRIQFGTGIAVIVFGLVLYLVLLSLKIVIFLGFPIFFIAGIFLFAGVVGLITNFFFKPTREIDIEIQDVNNELDLLSFAGTAREQRAEKQFILHQFELKKYYDQTRGQSRWIFYVGVLCIVAGFVIIGFTGWGLNKLLRSGLAEKLDVGILTGATGLLSAILVEFVGKIYMDMYKKTIESLGEFHKRLVATHHLHFGNFLVAKIHEDNLREKTLAEIALKLPEMKDFESKAP